MDEDTPVVSDDLLSSVRSLQTKGEQPLLMLDLGESIARVEELCEGLNISVLGRNANKLRSEPIYSIHLSTKSWLLVPGSDHGLLPGSGARTYQGQLPPLGSACLKDYKVGSVRELVTLSVLKYVQDKVVLFPGRELAVFSRCAEKYDAEDGNTYNMILGGNGVKNGRLSGLVFLDHDVFRYFDNIGLFVRSWFGSGDDCFGAS